MFSPLQGAYAKRAGWLSNLDDDGQFNRQIKWHGNMAIHGANVASSMGEHVVEEFGCPVQDASMLIKPGCGVQMSIKSNDALERIKRPQCQSNVRKRIQRGQPRRLITLLDRQGFPQPPRKAQIAIFDGELAG